MRIHNLYEDADGESHFRDIEVDWVEETPTGKLSKRLPATGIMFRETTADYENSWHRAPRRQYVISLAGGISITASDGETRFADLRGAAHGAVARGCPLYERMGARRLR
jgi:hypothetical protein